MQRTFTNDQDVKNKNDTKFEQYFDTGAPDLVKIANTRLKNLVNRLKGVMPNENVVDFEVGLDIEQGLTTNLSEHEEYISDLCVAYENVMANVMQRVLADKLRYEQIRFKHNSKGM